nr:hypothetical protein B0A51_16721 [Rachicladosporium sp. CCFEE 5018]
MPLFSKFRSKSSQSVVKGKTQDIPNDANETLKRPTYQSTWSSPHVVLEEVQELIHLCTAELRLRAEALDSPFLLLPFRLDGDSTYARSFIVNFFKHNASNSSQFRGASLQQEIRLTEAPILCSVLKWCWSRIPGGVVSWPVYEGFRLGEQEMRNERNAFEKMLPVVANSAARESVIRDFFELLAAVAAHGKLNGLGGRKLSRLAGWWAFELSDEGKGFEGGYKSWTVAADAASHLFFAHLRSLSPEANPSLSLIERIPRSLQALLAQTEYPPETPTLMQRATPRVLMIVDAVSPTPFALLRRAKHFEYRDQDRVLRELSDFEDPIDALTDECRRVLYAVASTNSSANVRSRQGQYNNSDESWSAFSNMGFSDMGSSTPQTAVNGHAKGAGIKQTPHSRNATSGRPTTPSWADFLNSGFAEDENKHGSGALILPPDKLLPQIGSRAQTPSSNFGKSHGDDDLAPGELAAITNIDLDDVFWWVWMTSLAGEEPNERKSVFGRCALIETTIMNGRWLIMEEQVNGASPDPIAGAEIIEKKSRFGFTKRGRLGNRKASSKKPEPVGLEPDRATSATPSKQGVGADQQARIRAAAAAMSPSLAQSRDDAAQRRGRNEYAASTKTNSVLTLGLQSEAGPAMKWANSYDKHALRAQYLGDNFMGKGASRDDLAKRASSVMLENDYQATPGAQHLPILTPDAPAFPGPDTERELPSLPPAGSKATETPPAPQHEFIEQQAPPMPAALTPPVEETVAEPALVPSKSPEATVTPVEDPHDDSEDELDIVRRRRDEPVTAIQMLKELGMPKPSSPTHGRVQRKANPRTSNIQDHPAFRAPSVDQPRTVSPVEQNQNPAVLAARMALERKDARSAESDHKLQKKQGGGGGGGLKKLFGRGKDRTNRRSMEVPPSRSTLAPPSESSLGRRLSLMRKKSGQPAAAAAAAAQVPVEPQPALRESAEFTAQPQVPSSPAMYNDPEANLSRIETRDQNHANEEFSRFDQGPMQDMPGALPRESPDLHHESAQEDHTIAELESPDQHPQPHYNTRAAAMLDPRAEQQQPTPDQGFVTPLERSEPTMQHNDAASEASVEREDKPTVASLTQDRWAQIRENAAKRAARASEEQSMQSRPRTERTDEDGETSGEETIESRVARIKARVAELTGNMDTSASGATARVSPRY